MTRILIVEDDVHLMMGMRDLLELDGYECVLAENGKQGLQVLQTLDLLPDCAIIGFMMPVMCGDEMIRIMQAHDTWKTIPVIAMSALGSLLDKLTGVYKIRPPFDADDLLELVKKATSRTEER